MSRCITLVGLSVLCAGCGAPAARDAAPVYEAVLRQKLLAQNRGDGVYLSIDGQDPSPELLARFQKQWPGLEPASKQVGRKARHVHLGDLKWLDGDTAEVRGGYSDGIDGEVSRYRVARKNGLWVVEKAEVEAIS